MKLFCDGLPKAILDKLLLIYNSNEDPPTFDFLNPTPAEACLCSKDVEICWRYDANLYAEAKEGECTRDNDHAAITVQDYAEVSLQQGSSPKNVLVYGKTTLQAKCNTDYIDKRTKTADLVAINQELGFISSEISLETDPDKLAELRVEYANKLAEYIAKQGEIEELANECESDYAINQLQDECRTITLKSNQKTYFRMNSAYKIEAKGEDCFYAYAKIKSDFYITAIMHSPNTTATDVKYCCAKKWGQYQLASFPGAPMSLT